MLLFISPGAVFATIHLFVTQLLPQFQSGILQYEGNPMRTGTRRDLQVTTGPWPYKYSWTDFDLLVNQLKHLSLAILVIFWAQLFIHHIGQYRHEMKTNTCNIYHRINYCKMKINSQSSYNGRYWLELQNTIWIASSWSRLISIRGKGHTEIAIGSLRKLAWTQTQPIVHIFHRMIKEVCL